MSMDAAVIDDLKQFIDATIVHRVTEIVDYKLEEKLEQKLNEKFDEKLAPIHQKIDDLTRYVAEAIDASNDAYQSWLEDHERRIGRLEKTGI